MRHVPLVIASFETLSEAEAAVSAVMDAGFQADTFRAAGRAGGGRLLLAGRVAVQPVGQPAKLVDRAERSSGAALLGAVLGAALALLIALALRLLGLDPLAPLRVYLAGSLLLYTAGAFAAFFGALVAIGALRSTGLPHDLALRYARRLDSGDVVLAVRAANGAQARSVQESLAINGATDVHLTRGSLETEGGEVAEAPTPFGVN